MLDPLQSRNAFDFDIGIQRKGLDGNASILS